MPFARISHAARLALAALLGLFLAFGAASAAEQFPELTGQVVDDAHVLSQPVKDKLTALLAEHEQQTGNQVVVVTLKQLDEPIETYGYQLGRKWGIGQKGKDNGALLIVTMKPHQVRIEVGYGLEGELTDAQSALIIHNTLIPAFRKGDYDTGILNGTVQILRTLGGKPSAKGVPQVQQRRAESGGGIPIIPIIILLIIGGRFFWPLLFMGGMGGGRGGGGFGGGFGGGGFGGGFGDGGGFGGGGFSGGGGSFGGGGASGSW